MVEKTSWQTSLMACLECEHGWLAVHPVVCEYLECPACHHMNPAPFVPGSECGPHGTKPRVGFLPKLMMRIKGWWCITFHQFFHEDYSFNFSFDFFKCNKCGMGHSRPRRK